MKITIRDININYIQYGSGEDIVLLHGWGQNIEMMKPLGNKFSNKYRITILDFPGFGQSDEPNEELTVFDYSNILNEMLKKINVSNPVIIGHSFGGRVAIVYASKYKVNKLVLFGSPCIRKDQNPSIKLRLLKSLKKVPVLNKFESFAKKHIGSRDYRNATSMMRKILVNVVNIDLTENAKNIKCPTLLMWGDKDSEAPLEDAKELEKIIKDCGLIVFHNSTHYAYLENLNEIAKILNNFFE